MARRSTVQRLTKSIIELINDVEPVMLRQNGIEFAANAWISVNDDVSWVILPLDKDIPMLTNPDNVYIRPGTVDYLRKQKEQRVRVLGF